jgi:D-methionine transport system ATP-binding protein
MEPAPAIVTFDKVSKSFNRPGHQAVAALRDLSLSVPRGQIVGIIGRSGAGKSTLLRLVNGLERPDSGQISVDGSDIPALTMTRLQQERRKIGMIFQHFNLLSSRTAFDNVALPLELTGRPMGEITKRVGLLLDLVGLSDKARRYPAELSGGQQQRIGIARALATGPKILLSDEATSALDPETTKSILALLAQVNVEFGVTIVLITHQMSVVKAICHRVGVIEDGQVVEEGSVTDIFSRPKSVITKSFIGPVLPVTLPKEVGVDLQIDRGGATHVVLRLVTMGEGAHIIGRIAREWQIDVAILYAQTEHIGDRAIGLFFISLPVEPTEKSFFWEFFPEGNVTVERVGYVV